MVQTFSDLNVTNNQEDKETEPNMIVDVLTRVRTEEKVSPVLLLSKRTLSDEGYCSSITEPLCKTTKQEQELQQLQILRSHRKPTNNNTVVEFFTKT